MLKRMAAACLCLMLATAWLLPAAAPAEEAATIVRVGWDDTLFNYTDSFGRRMGYAYEYQRKIAAYTGWQYEYVQGTWPELLQMLKDGRIDLMSDVSYIEKRKEQMLYSSIPMGSELYYLYIAADNADILRGDPGTLNGKSVGITTSTVQIGLLQDWLTTHSIAVNLVEVSYSEQESLNRLRRGEFDAFVTLDSFANADGVTPLWKIGSSDFFFAVRKDRLDLLTELNEALSRIQEENPFYSDELNAKYMANTVASKYLTAEEKAWLDDHGPIRVGYQDHYLAFCASDPKTGALTGALKDYLETASGVMENAQPTFVAVSYPTAAAALEAVRTGEVDCMFPANLTDFDGEQAGVVMTAPLMRTEMDAVVRAEDQQSFLRMGKVRVGVNRGNPNYEMFLLDHFPNWTPVYYTDTPACLDAVAARMADCIIISNYRFGDIAQQCSRLNLTTVDTGVDMDYCLAVREGNSTLYSILSRIIHQVPDSTVNAALTYYAKRSEQPDFFEYLRGYPLVAALGAACVVLLATVGVLTVKMRKNKKKAAE